MHIWLEDREGVRYGAGPIITASAWTQTARLNAAGEFSFTMPADDPRAQHVRPKRWARAWAFTEPGGWQQVGYGRIERVTRTVGVDGRAVLQADGVDELGELADRLCINLSLRTHEQKHPSRIFHWIDNTSTLDELTFCNDYLVGDTSTSDALTIDDYDDYLEIRASFTFDRITFTLAVANDNTAEMTAQYYSEDANDGAGGWAELTITDGTQTIGAFANAIAWGQSGDVTFTPPDDWIITPGSAGYHVRLYSTGTTNNLDISDISVWRYNGYANDEVLDAIMAYAPSGWSLDSINGYTYVNERPLGTELLTNGGLETIGGGDTPDDATSDTFTDWTNSLIDDGNGNSVLAVTTAHSGSYAAKLATGTSYTLIEQVASVTPGQVYTLSFWTCGDGASGEAAYKIYAGDHFDVYPAWDDLSEAIDTGITDTTWTNVTYTFTVPLGWNEVTIALFSPLALASYAIVDDISLRAGGGIAVYLQLRDESVLESLRRIAVLTAENFVLSPAGRQVLWLGQDVRDSGLRAIAADPPASTSDANTLLLTDLVEIEETFPLLSRVYPYGGGMGAERLTLAEAIGPVPDGYTLSVANNYIERDGAITTLGIVESAQQWPDIIAQDTSQTQQQFAANALMWQAWQYLETHSATDLGYGFSDAPHFYRATVVKSERMILPGYTLRLQYRRYRAGARVMDINRDVWVTAVTRQITPEGVYLVGLDLATVPRQAENDYTLISKNLIRLRDIASHNTAEGY